MGTINLFRTIFILAGLGMLAGSAYSVIHTNDFLTTAIHAQGKVTELVARRSDNSTLYAPKVRFYTPNQESISFTSSSSSNPPSYSRGDKVEVLYRPNQPSDAKINSFFSLWGTALILAILGAVFTAIGGGMLYMQIRNKKKIEWLKVQGQPIITQFQSVARNTSLKVNGKSPWVIHTQWNDTRDNKVYTFKSDNIWFDPESFIQDPHITVLVDRQNKKRYHMDISFLPEQA